MTEPFWQTKTLAELSAAEWESLCDGCGKCCLHKLEDEDTGRVHLTVIACRLLDIESCRCSHYEDRLRHVPACVRIAPHTVNELTLPSTCAYRLVAEGRPLESWHPLISGDPASVHAAGVSVQGWAVPEVEVPEEDFEDYIIAREAD
jgi:uncharacterized protein